MIYLFYRSSPLNSSCAVIPTCACRHWLVKQMNSRIYCSYMIAFRSFRSELLFALFSQSAVTSEKCKTPLQHTSGTKAKLVKEAASRMRIFSAHTVLTSEYIRNCREILQFMYYGGISKWGDDLSMVHMR